MSDSPSFSNFGNSFQEKLAHILLEDSSFADQMEELIQFNFFEKEYLRIFTRLIFDYRKEYNIHPSVEIMSALIRTELEKESELDRAQVSDFFERVCAKRYVEDADFVKDKSLRFCKNQKMKETLLKCVGLMNKGEFDAIEDLIKETMKLGLDNDYGHDFLKDFEARYQLEPRRPVATGWSNINKITQGGLGEGELGVVIAPTGAGKSHVLCHLGASAVQQGKSVVHYTLELSEKVVGHRYDSCISGIPLNYLESQKQTVLENIQDKVEGELIIKEYPTKSASLITLKRHLDKLVKKGHKVDLIIVDYGDLLKPVRSREQKRMELSDIYEGLRGLAKEYKCPIWTASQTNRKGLNEEVITMESISEAFSKCFVADFIFSLSRTVDDRTTNKGRIFIAKNRNGVDGIVYPVHMNTANVHIDVLEESSESPAEITANAEKNAKAKLAKIFQNIKEN